jgi:hypothetical protein
MTATARWPSSFCNEYRRLVVSISNKELALLHFVRDVVGAGRITCKRTYDPRHARSYAYQVSSRQALDLLRQTAHLLRSYKAARAHLALAEYVRLTPRNGKYGPGLREQRSEFEAKFLAIRASSRGFDSGHLHQSNGHRKVAVFTYRAMRRR